jgi:nucleoside-triphosphatase THEP1
MRLAVVSASRRGETDLLLSEVAGDLMRAGLRLAGVVQTNTEVPGRRHCEMDVRVLPDGPTICISQNLGPGARGCRLDPDGLERAVATVAPRLDGADLLILNKFGKHEAEGRGFVPLIAEALSREIPVLLGVSEANRAAFDVFAEGAATDLPAERAAILDWVQRQPA